MDQLKKILYKLFKKPNVYVYSYSLQEVDKNNFHTCYGVINDYGYAEVSGVLKTLETFVNKEKIILEKRGIEIQKGFHLISFAKI